MHCTGQGLPAWLPGNGPAPLPSQPSPAPVARLAHTPLSPAPSPLPPPRCWPGSWSGEGADDCNPCDVGFYQEQEGQAQCLACPAGSIAAVKGSLGCDNCEPGESLGRAQGSRSLRSCCSWGVTYRGWRWYGTQRGQRGMVPGDDGARVASGTQAVAPGPRTCRHDPAEGGPGLLHRLRCRKVHDREEGRLGPHPVQRVPTGVWGMLCAATAHSVP